MDDMRGLTGSKIRHRKGGADINLPATRTGRHTRRHQDHLRGRPPTFPSAVQTTSPNSGTRTGARVVTNEDIARPWKPDCLIQLVQEKSRDPRNEIRAAPDRDPGRAHGVPGCPTEGFIRGWVPAQPDRGVVEIAAPITNRLAVDVKKRRVGSLSPHNDAGLE